MIGKRSLYQTNRSENTLICMVFGVDYLKHKEATD